MPQNWTASLKFRKTWKINQRLSYVSEKISAKTALILSSKEFVISAIQSWISTVQRFLGDKQCWNRPEIILRQSWSALNVFETSNWDSNNIAFLDQSEKLSTRKSSSPNARKHLCIKKFMLFVLMWTHGACNFEFPTKKIKASFLWLWNYFIVKACNASIQNLKMKDLIEKS